MHVTVTRYALFAFLEGKERDEEDHAGDVDQDPGPRDHSAPSAAGPGQPFPDVPDADNGLVPVFLSGVSSSLYSSIGTMRGGAAARKRALRRRLRKDGVKCEQHDMKIKGQDPCRQRQICTAITSNLPLISVLLVRTCMVNVGSVASSH